MIKIVNLFLGLSLLLLLGPFTNPSGLERIIKVMPATLFCGGIDWEGLKRLLSLSSLLLLIVMLLSGCITIGPDYRPPDLVVPEQWGAELTGESSAKLLDTETLANWWSTLNDPRLTSIINRAVEGNLDLRKAKARGREIT